MSIVDYGRSFLRGTAAFNRVRFWVESRTILIDERSGDRETFWQCGACKSENTFAEKDLFQGPNYDFTPVFSDRHLIVFRRGASLGDHPAVYRSVRENEAVWGKPEFRIVESASPRLLETNEQIRQATHDFCPLVAQTEIWNEAEKLRALIEYPVKTMNILDEKNQYQVDTGPVAFLDLSARRDCWAEAVSLAYVAFNAPDFADFVLEAPTAIRRQEREVCQVYHYSDVQSLKAENRLYAIE